MKSLFCAIVAAALAYAGAASADGCIVHTGRIEQGGIRWQTQALDGTVTIAQQSGTRRLEPPLVASEPQLVVLESGGLVFRPSADVEHRHTPRGIEIGRGPNARWSEVLACAHDRGIRTSATTLLVRPDARLTAIDGAFERHDASKRTLLVSSAAVSIAAVAALIAAYRRLARRVRLETAHAVLYDDLSEL